MKKILVVACTVASLFPGRAVHAQGPAKPNGTVPQLTPQQKQQLLGEVIGVGVAGAVIGAAIQSNQNNRQNNWNNNNNYNYNNNWNNNGNWNNGGRRYDSVPSYNSRRQSAPVYRESYPTQSERVYSPQPVYSSTIEGERIISSSPVITSSSPVITSERVITSSPSFSNERVISSSPSVSSERVVSSLAVKENSLPYKGPGVKIALQAEVGGEVTFVIDGHEESTIQAGTEQTLTKKGKYEIRFSRGRSPEGKDYGLARYTITEGTYNFEVTENGWDLLRDKDVPTNVTSATSPSGIKTNVIPAKPSVAKPGDGSPTPAVPAG